MNTPLSYQTIDVTCFSQTLKVRYVETGVGKPLLFLHGWGTGLYTFFGLMDSLSATHKVIALDFPGFGESTLPTDVWGTPEYAEFTLAFARTLGIHQCDLISHSFGGRVAMRLAILAPEFAGRMVLIASAGIKRPQPLLKKLRIQTIQTLAKTAGSFLPSMIGKPLKQKLYFLIASPDYLQAGELKNIFVRVVNEDMKELLPQIQTPILLIYGSGDVMTPPQVGQILQDGLLHSRYIELPGFDHNSILDRGRHQVCHHIQQWLNTESLEHSHAE